MKYKVFRLSRKEALEPKLCGLKYAMENEDKWEDCGIESPENHFSTYDAARTFMVFDNIAYMISRDYIIPEKNTRLYILIDRDLVNDRVE